MVTEATSRGELPIDGPELTVVDFYRNDCRFCDMLVPVLDEVEFDVPFAQIVKINCSEVEGIAEEWDIQAFPTIKLFRDGEPVDSITGFVPAPVLAERVSRQLYA